MLLYPLIFKILFYRKVFYPSYSIDNLITDHSFLFYTDNVAIFNFYFENECLNLLYYNYFIYLKNYSNRF